MAGCLPPLPPLPQSLSPPPPSSTHSTTLNPTHPQVSRPLLLHLAPRLACPSALVDSLMPVGPAQTLSICPGTVFQIPLSRGFHLLLIFPQLSASHGDTIAVNREGFCVWSLVYVAMALRSPWEGGHNVPLTFTPQPSPSACVCCTGLKRAWDFPEIQSGSNQKHDAEAQDWGSRLNSFAASRCLEM